MKFRNTNKKLLFYIFILLWSSCVAQRRGKISSNDIYGQWKCVKLDKRGFQKYTLEQAKMLEASTLTIDSGKFFYGDEIDFVKPCSFYRWKKSTYDTVNLSGNILDITYKKVELSKISKLEPVDEKGEFGCFNNCAIFYFKQDTLINICGGYTLFLLKVKEIQEGSSSTISADTVRCRYKEKGGVCTGFVIQGSRKNGKVIHVKPVNKNVPLESEEQKKRK